MDHINNIRKYYEKNDIKDRPDYFVLGWESEAAQKLRFKEMIGSIQLDNKKILDVGCGTGNLLEYIGERFSGYSYTGIDVLSMMIEKAKRKNLRGEFICMDLFKNNVYKPKSFDVIFSSGIFNLNLGNNQEFLKRAVEQFAGIAREAVSFNLLWDKSQDKDNKYYYFSPDEVYHYIKTHYRQFWSITITKGYLHNDFTVTLIRNNKNEMANE